MRSHCQSCFTIVLLLPPSPQSCFSVFACVRARARCVVRAGVCKVAEESMLLQISGLKGKLEDGALEHNALARINQELNEALGKAQHQVRKAQHQVHLHAASLCHLQASATQARGRGKHRSLARRVLGWWVSYRHVVRRLRQASHALNRRRQVSHACPH
jgi:hypothetical protein